MTADRSTLAGMILAFALLCAATMVFLFASTLLSFHSWPQLTSSSESRPLIVSSVAAAAPPVRILTVAPPAPARAVTHRAATTDGSLGPVRRYASVPGSGNMIAPVSAPKAPDPSYSSDSGNGQKSAPQSAPPVDKPPANDGSSGGIVGTVQRTARQTGSLLGNTTQGATAAVGSTVAAVTTTVGRVAGVVSPPLGQTVAGVGNAVNSTLTSVGKLVGALLGGAAENAPATP